MYKTFKKQDWLKMLNLSSNYSVDGVIAVGAAVQEKQKGKRDKVIEELGLEVKFEKLEHRFFTSLDVLNIDGKRYWFDVVYGGAYLSEILHLACVFGSKKNILLGSCGGLSKEVKSGDIVIPVYSYGNESTTRTYQRDVKENKHYSKKQLNRKIKSMFPSRFKVFEGSVVTCQAMLGETKEDIERWSKSGYLGVEMESSTFFAISNHFTIPASAILHVSDNLLKEEYVGSEEYEKGRKFRGEVIMEKYKIALQIITGMF